ncbi:MAG: hypothetical protein HQ483_16560 [Rhodospirillales bacterium]|nr:hypothetical protein [Rhodospirillales bacterium]
MPKSSMAKADFITSLIFFVLGLYMIIEGLAMPGAGGFIEAGGEPGRVPVLLGCIVAFFATILLIRSVARKGHKLLENLEDTGIVTPGAWRCAATAAGCSLYAVGLLGATIGGWQVRYHEATAVFMFLFILGFEWEEAVELGGRRWNWLQARWPLLASGLAALFSSLPAARAPFVWLVFTALLQAVLVTWGVTYLFEQEFYVKLP